MTSVTEQDETAKLRRSARILANIVARNHQVMEAARIEMRQNGPHKAMQWILNSLGDVWDDPETEWDGTESADTWFDRTEAFYRAAEADAERAAGESPSPAPREDSAASTEAPGAVLDEAVKAARTADHAWHEANRGNWESVAPRQVRRLIEGAAPVLVAAATARAEAAEARLAAIAEHCRQRMNAPGRSGMTRAAAELILGLAGGTGEEVTSGAR